MDETKVREHREALGWTQFHLAVAACVSPSTIYRAERGDNISRASLNRIGSALVHAMNGRPPATTAGKNIGAHPRPVKKRVGSTTTEG